MAQWVTNLINLHEDAGSIPGLVSKLRIWRCHKLQHSHRCGSDRSGMAVV